MRDLISSILLAVLMQLGCSGCLIADDGWDELARTPPMGWNSWNTFRLEINEDLVKGIADMVVEKGLQEAGYEVLAILTNKDVIAVNQDPLGRQGRKVRDDGDFEVWSKELHDGTRAVVLFNRSMQDAEISLTWPEIGIPERLTMTVTDLWDKTESSKHQGTFSSHVPAHGVVMVTVK